MFLNEQAGLYARIAAICEFMIFKHVHLTILCVLIALLLAFSAAHAQQDEDFLARAIPLAIKSQRSTTVPASVTLAQAIWETGRGKHPIGDANNYFGIKAGSANSDVLVLGPIASGWVWANTKEWNGSRYVERRERFRKYASMEDSFRDHGLLLATAPRYADAMRAVDDPREFARRIAAAGYATSPTYAADLIRVMDAGNYYQYDLPRNDLELVDQSDPIEVNPGDIFQVYFDVKNTGFGTWSSAADYYLVSANENRLGADAHHELGQLVLPEATKRWAITMFAPTTPGTFSTVWQVKHGSNNVGSALRAQVIVRPAPTQASWMLVGGAAALLVVGIAIVLVYRQRVGKRKPLRPARS